MKEIIDEAILTSLKELDLVPVGGMPRAFLEHPKDFKNGDYSFPVIRIIQTNIGTQRSLKRDFPGSFASVGTPADDPLRTAKEVVIHLEGKNIEGIEKIEAVAPGFINFYLSKKYFVDKVAEILSLSKNFGHSDLLSGKKIMI